MFDNVSMKDISDIFTAVGVTATAVMGIINTLQNRTNAQKIETIHTATNSMKDALVKATSVAGIAEGRQMERDEQISGQAAAASPAPSGGGQPAIPGRVIPSSEKR